MSKALELAEQVAHSLGMNVYLREDGTIAQHPPGKLVEAPASAKMQTWSHGAEPAPAAPAPGG
jgi:hypothetical protein